MKTKGQMKWTFYETAFSVYCITDLSCNQIPGNCKRARERERHLSFYNYKCNDSTSLQMLPSNWMNNFWSISVLTLQDMTRIKKISIWTISEHTFCTHLSVLRDHKMSYIYIEPNWFLSNSNFVLLHWNKQNIFKFQLQTYEHKDRYQRKNWDIFHVMVNAI